jgi:hypothetical protein
LLNVTPMQDGSDFSLPIVVVLPDRKVIVDERARTKPFIRANLPGVDLRPPNERSTPVLERRPSRPSPIAPEAAPLPAPRHAWLGSQAAQVHARSVLEVPPPPAPRAVPLSDDDEQRALRRARAYRRQAWAQRMLERFQFESPA